MKLYEIAKNLEELLEQIEILAEENEGEIPEDLSSQLDAYEEQKADKIEGIALYYKGTIAEAKAINDEIKALQVREKSLKNKSEWLKNYLSTYSSGEVYKTSRMSLTWRKSESVNVLDVDIIDKKYLRIKIEPDKTAIKQSIKSGVVVVGAELIEKQNIQIK